MEHVQLVSATCQRIHKYTTAHMLCAAQESNDDSVGITIPDSDVEDAPSVVRVGVTPDTADPDDVTVGCVICAVRQVVQ